MNFVTRSERFAAKYSQTAEGGKKEMNVMGRRGPGGHVGMGGKPKNALKSLGRLLSYLAHEKGLLITALVFSMLYTAASLVSSYMLRPVVNSLTDATRTPKERLLRLTVGIGVMALVYAVSIISQWAQQRLMLAVSQRSLKRMRSELYRKIQTLPVRYFDTHRAGDIMSRFTNDVDTVGEMLNTTLIQIISGVITLIGTVVLMIYTNWILGLITLIMTPLLTIVSRAILKKGRTAYKEQQKSLGILNGFSEEIISGQKVVKVFNHEAVATDEFEFLNEQLASSQIKAQFRSGIMGPVTHQLCNVSYGIVACVGGVLVALSGFDYGGLAISLNFTRSFNRPINEISMQLNVILSALAGAERVFDGGRGCGFSREACRTHRP